MDMMMMMMMICYDDHSPTNTKSTCTTQWYIKQVYHLLVSLFHMLQTIQNLTTFS